MGESAYSEYVHHPRPLFKKVLPAVEGFAVRVGAGEVAIPIPRRPSAIWHPEVNRKLQEGNPLEEKDSSLHRLAGIGIADSVVLEFEAETTPFASLTEDMQRAITWACTGESYRAEDGGDSRHGGYASRIQEHVASAARGDASAFDLVQMATADVHRSAVLDEQDPDAQEEHWVMEGAIVVMLIEWKVQAKAQGKVAERVAIGYLEVLEIPEGITRNKKVIRLV